MSVKIQQPTGNDWPLFLRWADQEGWTVPLREQLLFQHQWRPFFFSLTHNGKTCGFVSAVGYRHSGWIGNLLIDPRCRGQGYGRKLFEEALSFLRQRQLKRVWLTASRQGASLYQGYGFQQIDTIIRWSAAGKGDTLPKPSQAVLHCLSALEQDSWGEDRGDLINALALDSILLQQRENLALLQSGLDVWQLGPWSRTGTDPRQLRSLLDAAVAATPTGKHLFVDVLASAGLELMLRQAGFVRHGDNSLMYQGETPQLRGVIALASFGSIG